MCLKKNIILFLLAIGALPAALSAQEWTELASPTSEHLRGLWGSAAGDVYAVGGYDTTIIHYDGIAWSDIENQLPFMATADTYGIWGSSENNIYTVGGWSYWGLHKGNILHYDGSQWRSETDNPNSFLAWTNELRNIWGSSEDDIFAVGQRNYVITRLRWVGPILHYDGARVREMANPRENTDDADLFDVWGTGPDDVFAVGVALERVCMQYRCFFGFCYCSDFDPYDYTSIMHYDGSAWTMFETGVDADLFGVWGNSGDDVFAVGEKGAILHYDGSAWEPMISPLAEDLFDVWGSGPADVYAVGENGVIVHYDGSTWSAMETPTQRNLNALWGASAERVFAVGDNGTILILADMLDYGDAPDPTYPSYYFNDGARHAATDYVWLGSDVDKEPDIIRESDNYDDGITFIGSSTASGGPYTMPYKAGEYGAITVQISGGPEADNYVHGWVDWNNDGDWDDDLENIICGKKLAAPGEYTVEFQIPDVITGSCTWTRFRIDAAENRCAYTGMAAFGEVEDYELCPTLIELAAFTATAFDGTVMLEWTTASEIDNTGFNLYRATGLSSPRARINETLIPARGAADERTVYAYTDDGVQNGTAYDYWLEDIDTAGVSSLHGPVSATPQAQSAACFALSEVTFSAGQTTITDSGNDRTSCIAPLKIHNDGSTAVLAFWFVSDSYTLTEGWQSMIVQPGETATSEQTAFGNIKLNFGAERIIETTAATAVNYSDDYLLDCEWIIDALEHAGGSVSGIETISIKNKNPCD